MDFPERAAILLLFEIPQVSSRLWLAASSSTVSTRQNGWKAEQEVKRRRPGPLKAKQPRTRRSRSYKKPQHHQHQQKSEIDAETATYNTLSICYCRTGECEGYPCRDNDVRFWEESEEVSVKPCSRLGGGSGVSPSCTFLAP